MKRIVLVSALPHEYGRFKRLTGPWHVLSRTPLKSFGGSVFEKELILLETGMGKGRIEEAFRWLLGRTRPDLIVSMGFAGSLCSEFAVGQVILGSRVLRAASVPPSDSDIPDGNSELRLEIPSSLADFCLRNGIRIARMITVERQESKEMLRRRLGGPSSVSDMESYFACRHSQEEGIPFMSLRAVSDGVDDEIDFDLGDVADSTGRVRVCKAMLAVMKRPRLLRSFFHLWRTSRRAAIRLADALMKLLSLPESDLRQMVPGSGRRDAGFEPFRGGREREVS